MTSEIQNLGNELLKQSLKVLHGLLLTVKPHTINTGIFMTPTRLLHFRVKTRTFDAFSPIVHTKTTKKR